MAKIRVPVAGSIGKSVQVEVGSTAGATIGTDLKLPDGSVPTLAQLAVALGVGPQASTFSSTLWKLVGEIPPNIVAIAALSQNGFLVRNADGSWRLVPTPVQPGVDGEPGEDGPPGPPGLAGAKGDKGDRGPPGDDGLPGDDGTPGPPGQQGPAGSGATGAQGPMGNPGIDGSDGADGDSGPPGPAGATGTTGGQGATGPPVIFELDTPDDPIIVPGPQGPAGAAGSAGSAGATGTTGGQGATGPPVIFELDIPDDPIPVPGPMGPIGSTGAQGPAGPPIIFEQDQPDDPIMPVLLPLANASGLVGLAAVAGKSTNGMRSDGAPALDVTIAPTWTGAHSFNATGVQVQPASGGNKGAGTVNAGTGYYVNGVALGLSGINILKVGVTETRATATAPTNSTSLTFAIPQAGTYEIEVVAQVQQGAAGSVGINLNVNFSGTITNSCAVYMAQNSTGAFAIPGTGVAAAVGTTETSCPALATFGQFVYIKAILQAGTSGTLAFAFAQNTSSATTTQLLAGSYMTVKQIG